MCLIFLGFRCRKETPLVLIGNRDEFYERPTAAAHFWPEAPQVLAGRDLVGGGTWLGVTREGRWAALANFREPAPPVPGRSRGGLVADYLRGRQAPQNFLKQVAAEGETFKGFNLLVGDRQSAAYYSNREGRIRDLAPGVYGLSNHLLDTPWPKLRTGREAFRRELARPAGPATRRLLALLADTRRAPEEELPDTGVGRARERTLSARFIVSPNYGTRASTVVKMNRRGSVLFLERSFDQRPDRYRDRCFRFRLARPLRR